MATRIGAVTQSAESHPRRPMRPVRSYVLRQGRMSPAQHRAYEELAPRYAIAYSPRMLDLAEAFGRAAPTVLEIGSGMGETTAAMALERPDLNLLAIEVHRPGIASLARRLDESSVGHVRIVEHDAREVVRDMIAPDSLFAVRIFFPDPWPKTRHHKRRLVQAPFVRQLAERLLRGGTLHIATDWEDYAQSMRDVLAREPFLASLDEADAEPSRPTTKFERRGLRHGHRVFDLRFARR